MTLSLLVRIPGRHVGHPAESSFRRYLFPEWRLTTVQRCKVATFIVNMCQAHKSRQQRQKNRTSERPLIKILARRSQKRCTRNCTTPLYLETSWQQQTRDQPCLYMHYTLFSILIAKQRLHLLCTLFCRTERTLVPYMKLIQSVSSAPGPFFLSLIPILFIFGWRLFPRVQMLCADTAIARSSSFTGSPRSPSSTSPSLCASCY